MHGRGLEEIALLVSDKSLGLLEALGEFYPLAKWQRCAVHFYRNVLHAVPNGKVREVSVKTYGPLILERNFDQAGFAAKLGAKDMGLVRGAAKAAHAPMPFAALLEDRFLRALACGMGEKDWSVIGQLQREDAGLPR